jgi:cytochrome c oxidase accessory protein FixG
MYFADAPTLTVDFWTGQAAPVAYATVGVLTATTLVFGGFMREQVCVYMCPWPRIQTAMLDEKSLIVTYKDWRGEPRGSVKKAEKNPGEVGDCIDCNGCVNVCPTGYDIRNGPDIRCITCALCIDECDKVMKAIGRPRGLIDYATLEDCELERKGGEPRPITKALFHTRTLIYTGIWALIGFALLFALGTRERIDIKVQKDRNPPYTVQSSGEIRNDYTVKLLNMEARPREMRVSLEGLPGGKFWTNDTPRGQAARELTVKVPADRVEPLRVYVVAPDGTAAQGFLFQLKALDEEGGEARAEVKFDSPVDAEETEQ